MFATRSTDLPSSRAVSMQASKDCAGPLIVKVQEVPADDLIKRVNDAETIRDNISVFKSTNDRISVLGNSREALEKRRDD